MVFVVKLPFPYNCVPYQWSWVIFHFGPNTSLSIPHGYLSEMRPWFMCMNQKKNVFITTAKKLLNTTLSSRLTSENASHKSNARVECGLSVFEIYKLKSSKPLAPKHKGPEIPQGFPQSPVITSAASAGDQANPCWISAPDYYFSFLLTAAVTRPTITCFIFSTLMKASTTYSP